MKISLPTENSLQKKAAALLPLEEDMELCKPNKTNLVSWDLQCSLADAVSLTNTLVSSLHPTRKQNRALEDLLAH